MAERHNDNEVDLRGASKLITGVPMSAEAQAKVYEVSAKLGIRPDDPTFSFMVALDSYKSFFATIPDRMAAAAQEAAADVGSAARDVTEKALAEAVTAAVDMQAFNANFRKWALVTLAVIAVMNGVSEYARYRLTADVGENAKKTYLSVASEAKQEIDAARQSMINVTTEAATRAALAASENTAIGTANQLRAYLEKAAQTQVAENLKYGKANVTDIDALIYLEKRQVGSIHNLVTLATAGWQSLVAANPNGPCSAGGYAENGMRTCILWAPHQ